uniref:Uncharacterized protein n=1 Tax=Rhizophora mucronata TaxID=61149 RepID=A0A2P2QZ07_RHIMU
MICSTFCHICLKNLTL